MKKNLRTLSLLVLTVSMTQIANAQGSVIFNQSFNFTAGKNGAVTSEGDPYLLGWRGSYGPNGTLLPFSAPNDIIVGDFWFALSDGNFIYASSRIPANPAAWMIHTTNLDVQYEDVTTTGYNTLDLYANVPEQVLTGRTYSELQQLDVELRLPDATDIPCHFAIEVDLGSGPEWLITATGFTGVDNSFSLYSLSTGPSTNWLRNVYIPDSFLVNGPISGTPVNIPDGAPISGFGLYAEVPDSFTDGGTGTNSSSNRVRMREFNITMDFVPVGEILEGLDFQPTTGGFNITFDARRFGTFKAQKSTDLGDSDPWTVVSGLEGTATNFGESITIFVPDVELPGFFRLLFEE